jgi:hypothetical protein
VQAGGKFGGVQLIPMIENSDFGWSSRFSAALSFCFPKRASAPENERGSFAARWLNTEC